MTPGAFSRLEVRTSLTAIAVAVAISITVSRSPMTRITCPSGQCAYERAGAWLTNVQRIADRHGHSGRGDVFKCSCSQCKGKWYEVTMYPKVA